MKGRAPLAVLGALVMLGSTLGVACTGARAPTRPDEACATTCRARIPRCGVGDCARGCSLAEDRLVEGEGDAVLACVARSSAACDDWLWAGCAVRVGVHADGGPPAPPGGPRR